MDYLEDRLTGTEVFKRFKVLQDMGIREKNRYPSNGEIDIPYKRSEGRVLGKKSGGRPPLLNTVQIAEIQHARNVLGRTVQKPGRLVRSVSLHGEKRFKHKYDDRAR